MNEESCLWGSVESEVQGLPKEQILKWESDHGLQLPKTLRRAYREQNGGVVKGTSIHLFPLEDFVVPDDEMWGWGLKDEENFEDRNRVIVIGDDNNVGGNFLLNYNCCHEDGDPSIWSYFYDGTGANRLSKSVSRFLKKASAISESPTVDWSESNTLPILIDESIDESPWLPPGTITRYRLIRQDAKLVLFRQGLNLESGDGGQRFTRTELPLPLDADSTELKLRRPGGPWALSLKPENSDEIVSMESVQVPSGGWKNRRHQGVPIYEMIESESKERLEQLRVQLIGQAAADEARARDDSMAALQKRMQESPPEQMKLMGLQMLQAMQGELPELTPVGDVPPELAAVTAHVDEMRRKMFENLSQEVGQQPIIPEVQAMIDGLKKQMEKVNRKLGQ